MSPGLRLAVAWAVRVAAWPAIVGGAYHLLFGVLLVAIGIDGGPLVALGVAAAGLIVLTVGWFANTKAAEAIRRLNEAQRGVRPRGFDVVMPAAPPHQP